MSGDISLTWNVKVGAADFSIVKNDLATDGGLETAIMLSLFTDRRAEAGDVLPVGQTDRRGWWGDAFPVVEGDRIGSRLWLLARSKRSQEVVDRAKEYATEALQWLVDDLVASRVDVESAIMGDGILGIGVTVYRPSVDPVTFRFSYAWASQEAKRA